MNPPRQIPPITQLIPILTIFALVTACAPQPELAFVTPPEVRQNLNPRAPLAAIVRFDARGAAEVQVTATPASEAADASDQEALELSFTQDPSGGLPILGLKPDREYRLVVRLKDADGNVVTAANAISYRTPSLPTGKGDFPPLETHVSVPSRMEPGVTFLSIRRRVPGRPHWLTPAQRRYSANWGTIVAVDAAGEVVWYYEA
ncbi:MAG: hypothetical protein F4X31_06820, partial [Gammaproteobacteria bacterium]|nr:hypothetical protein [Gammaproteobacteria bacterium]